MGCDQSRDKTKEADTFAKAADFAVAIPLPLHIYEEYTKAYTIFNVAPSPTNSSPSNQSSPSAPSLPSSPPTPTSQASPKSHASQTSLKRSLAIKRSASLPKKSKAFEGMSASRIAKLKGIAIYKFPKFRKFSKLVQEEILLHIDKEIHSMG